jgi:tetratricopeptide (TPR) repeat protein
MDSLDIHVERGRSLLNLGRIKEAAAELEKALVFEDNNLDALILICVCYVNLNDNPKAKEYTAKLLARAPDLSIAYYYQAICYIRDKDSKAAETSIRQAISLDPNDADYWALLSDIYSDRKEWEQALEYANKGLECDPENINSLNHRTLCLTKLDRLDEMQSNIDETLASDPYNAYTHSNVGWSKLETGDYIAAKQHFAEALRLNPNLENARQGMVNAVKSRNIIFRWFLQYGFWMANKKDSAQWAIIIGFLIGRRIIFAFASEYPVLYLVGFLLLFFTYLTWLIHPLTDFFLLMDRFGRHVLSSDEKKAAGISGGAVIGSLIFAGLAYFTGYFPFWYLTIYLASIAIPLSRYYGYPASRRGPMITIYTIALALLGLLVVGLSFMGAVAFAENLGGMYLIGFAIYTWVAGGLVRKF